MNERIRELAEQSIGANPTYAAATIMASPELEQFAMLIVRECAGIYDKIDNGNAHLGTEDYLEALHKHFGVK